VAGSERVVPVDGVDGRLGPGTRNRCRAGRVDRVRAAREPDGRVAHTVHHKLFGWPPFQAHEQHKRDTLQHDGSRIIAHVQNDNDLLVLTIRPESRYS